ncbi:MAG: caspase family protein [Bacteroidales bacterium]|nr:caspase family protein [Bacteroidales bacterium]
MRRQISLWMILLFPGLLFAGDCGKGKIFAVIVGVSLYENHRLNLKYCDQDAKALYDVLLRHTDAGNLTLLTDKQATKKQVLAQVNKLFAKAGPDDRILFFFSGHGDKDCFLTYEAAGTNASMISFEEVKSAFRKSNAGTKVLIADACMSGSIRENRPDDNPGTQEISSRSKKQVLVMASSRNEQISREFPHLKHGLFTYYLLKGLRGACDINNDRKISVKELYKYLYIQVKTESKGRQIPVAWGSFDKDLPLLCW